MTIDFIKQKQDEYYELYNSYLEKGDTKEAERAFVEYEDYTEQLKRWEWD